MYYIMYEWSGFVCAWKMCEYGIAQKYYEQFMVMQHIWNVVGF